LLLLTTLPLTDSAPYLQVYFIWMTTQAPGRLQNDNGTEFCAEVMQQLCDMFGVEMVSGAVGHPQSQVG
jgi:hypothetical protein